MESVKQGNWRLSEQRKGGIKCNTNNCGIKREIQIVHRLNIYHK